MAFRSIVSLLRAIRCSPWDSRQHFIAARAVILSSIACLANATIFAAPVTFRVVLDERAPSSAAVELDLPPSRTGEMLLGAGPRSAATIVDQPQCDGAPLLAKAPRRWIAPVACRTVKWTVALRDPDREGIDASDPTGGWSARGRWWLLTDHLAFLAPAGGWDDARVEIKARWHGGKLGKSIHPFPHRGQLPFYAIVSAAPPQRYRSGSFGLRVFGEVPPEAGSDQMRFVASVLDRWRRDIIPADISAPATLDILWIPAPRQAEPAFLASAGMRAVLMQNIPGPDPEGSSAKLRATSLMGVHEGFHSLSGAIPQKALPAWANESWASYFAFQAAKTQLDAKALEIVRALIDAPSSASLLDVQAQVDHGDGSNYNVFYGKGARFWAAIDAVLVTRSNPSGRLAALIQDTHGLQGLDWSKPDAIAAYLDARSGGRASAIVQCYLVKPDCN